MTGMDGLVASRASTTTWRIGGQAGNITNWRLTIDIGQADNSQLDWWMSRLSKVLCTESFKQQDAISIMSKHFKIGNSGK